MHRGTERQRPNLTVTLQSNAGDGLNDRSEDRIGILLRVSGPRLVQWVSDRCDAATRPDTSYATDFVLVVPMSTPMTISSWSLTRPPPAALDFILQVINIADKRHDDVTVPGSSAGLCDHGGMVTKKGPATGRTGASVAEFLARIPDPQRREDARRLCAVMEEITGEPPAMWGTSIIGFGAIPLPLRESRKLTK